MTPWERSKRVVDDPEVTPHAIEARREYDIEPLRASIGKQIEEASFQSGCFAAVIALMFGFVLGCLFAVQMHKWYPPTPAPGKEANAHATIPRDGV
jgi:hypothetical protein